MLLSERLSQIVPTLTPGQIQFALRFASGPARRFAPNEILLDVGDRDTDVWLVVEGTIVAHRREGRLRRLPVRSAAPSVLVDRQRRHRRGHDARVHSEASSLS